MVNAPDCRSGTRVVNVVGSSPTLPTFLVGMQMVKRAGCNPVALWYQGIAGPNPALLTKY